MIYLFEKIWSELSPAVASIAPVAIKTVATEALATPPAPVVEFGALRAGVIRRQSARRASESTIQRDRRAKGNPPFQCLEKGVA